MPKITKLVIPENHAMHTPRSPNVFFADMINANEMIIIILYTPCMIVLLDIIYRVRRHIGKLLHVRKMCVKGFLIFFNEYKNIVT